MSSLFIEKKDSLSFTVGEKSPTLNVGPITIINTVRFAGASGDFNPVHYDQDLARSLGFPNFFLMGMLPGAVLAEFASEWLSPLKISELQIRFVGRMWPEDEIILGGEITHIEKDFKITLSAKLWAKTLDNTIKILVSCVADE